MFKKILFVFLAFALFFNARAASLKEDLMPSFASSVYDRRGRLIGFFYKNHFRLYAPYRSIPKRLIYAVVSAEDERFFEHKGVDPLGILRAAIRDIRAGRIVQGGSTITQQLAKMIFLSPKRTFERKIKEIGIARELDEKLSKQDVLELYLNYVYLGSGAYGVKAAAWVYFGKPLSKLDLAQCALLAGLIRGPEYYNPFKHPERALKRRDWVLRQMLKNGYISKSEYLKAQTKPLEILPKPNVPRAAGYDLDFVKFKLKKILGNSIYTRGYIIKTTLDSEAQKFAQSVLAQYDELYSKKHKLKDLECAAFAMLRDGQVLLVVGGKGYNQTKLNRAFQVGRPIGSTAKPITYLSAFEVGISPYDLIPNTPFSMKIGRNKIWKPENYSHRYTRYVEILKGLEKSINLATLHLAMLLPSKVKENMQKFEMPLTDSFDLSYVLGSFPSNLYRIVRAFSAFQNGGLMFEPYVVKAVLSKDGKVIYVGRPSFKFVAPSRYTNEVRSVLQQVVLNGTGRAVSYLAKYFDLAGKTGTTNNWRDAYFTGFTSSFVMSVWFGRDSYKRMWKGAAGGAVSAPPWGKIAKSLCLAYGCGRFSPTYAAIVKNFYQYPVLPVKTNLGELLLQEGLGADSYYEIMSKESPTEERFSKLLEKDNGTLQVKNKAFLERFLTLSSSQRPANAQ